MTGMTPDVILLCGISGSGKSAYARYLQERESGQPGLPNLTVISTDKLRCALIGDINDQSFNKTVHSVADELAIWHIQHGRRVVLDATNTCLDLLIARIERLRHGVMLEQAFHGMHAGTRCGVTGPTIELHILYCRPETAYARVRHDLSDHVLRTNVPYEGIHRQYEQFTNLLANLDRLPLPDGSIRQPGQEGVVW